MFQVPEELAQPKGLLVRSWELEAVGARQKSELCLHGLYTFVRLQLMFPVSGISISCRLHSVYSSSAVIF